MQSHRPVWVDTLKRLRHRLEVAVGEEDGAESLELGQVPLQRATASVPRAAHPALRPRKVEKLVRVDVQQPLVALLATARDRMLAIEHLPSLHLGRRVQAQPRPRRQPLPLTLEGSIAHPNRDTIGRVAARDTDARVVGVVKVQVEPRKSYVQVVTNERVQRRAIERHRADYSRAARAWHGLWWICRDGQWN